jgi:hypothetical protein
LLLLMCSNLPPRSLQVCFVLFIQVAFNQDHIPLALLSSQNSKAPQEFRHLNVTLAAKAFAGPSDRSRDAASSSCSISNLGGRTPAVSLPTVELSPVTTQHSTSLPSGSTVVPTPPPPPTSLRVVISPLTIQHPLQSTASLPFGTSVPPTPPPPPPQRVEVISLLCFAKLMFYLSDSHHRMMTHRQVRRRSRALTPVPKGLPLGNPIPPVKESMTRPEWWLTLKARVLPFSHRKSCLLYFVFTCLMSSRNTM